MRMSDEERARLRVLVEGAADGAPAHTEATAPRETDVRVEARVRETAE